MHRLEYCESCTICISVELLGVYGDAETNFVELDEGSSFSSVCAVRIRAMIDRSIHEVAGIYNAE